MPMTNIADKRLPCFARLTCAALLCVALLPGTASGAAAPPVADVRILIDVSGSMKQTDPQNLRVPALRLLTGILPGNAQAGVWTFGRFVNMSVPFGPVDEVWRDTAIVATGDIRSIALHTNIEDALETATWNWRTPDDGVQRNLILFTDGMIDVPGGAVENARSRARITEALVPRLAHAGVRLHAIALSDATDEPLLRQLAAATGGRFEKTHDAAELERIFLRIFEQAVAPERLPLHDRHFLVDDSISELTLLAFRDTGSPPARLTAPDGTRYEAGKTPRGVRWHSDLRYDLVTIPDPAAGTWEIDAAIDPDNRIMVVSRLRLDATTLPSPMLAGDRQRLEVSLSNDGETIAKRDFLHFVRVEAGLRPDAGTDMTLRRALLDNGRDGDAAAGDGIHTLLLEDAQLPEGVHELTVDVDGTTFRRVQRQILEVVASPVINGIVERDGHDLLFVLPRAGLIDVDSLQITATVTSEDGAVRELPVPRSAPHEWRLDLGPTDSGRRQLVLDIVAQRPDGRPLRFRDAAIGFGTAAAVAAVDIRLLSESALAESVPAEPVPEPEPSAATAAPIGTETAPHEPDWTLIGLSVLLINLLLLAAIGLVWRRWYLPAPAKAIAWPEPASVVDTREAADDVVVSESDAGTERPPASDDETDAPAVETPREANDEGQKTVLKADADAAPDLAPTPFDEEIVLEGINFDDIELDFDDKAQKRDVG